MIVGVVIQARLDSSRLPQKSLKLLGSMTLIEWCRARCLCARKIDRVIVATTNRDIDTPLADKVAPDVFRGDFKDVIGRIVACAEEYGFDHIVRVSGDSPFIDPSVMDAMVSFHLEKGCDLTTNVMPRTFPPGCSIEIVKKDVLKDLSRLNLSDEEREHVTLGFYHRPHEYEILNYVNPEGDQSSYNYAMDTQEDFQRLATIAQTISIETSISTIIKMR